MKAPESTHHHGPLAGVTAGAAAVAVAGLLILATARRQLGEAAAVVMWALAAAVVGAVAAAAVYVFLWLRHRVIHPETLAGRHAVQAEVVSGADAAQPVPVPAGRMAAIEPPRDGQHLHLHLDGADPAVVATIMRHIRKDDEGR